jgi:CBS domain-containing protein
VSLLVPADGTTTEEEEDEENEESDSAQTSAMALESVLADVRSAPVMAPAAPRGTSTASSSHDGHSPSGSTPETGAQIQVDPLTVLHVRDAMLKTPRTVSETEPVVNALRLLDVRGSSLLVVDEHGNLTGIVTRSDLSKRPDQERVKLLTVGDVAVRNLIVTRPMETLRVAVHRMHALGLRQLPVIGSDLPGPPLGLLRRGDILAAYEQAVGTIGMPDSASSRPTA